MQMSVDSGPISFSLALFLGVRTGSESLVVGTGHGWALPWAAGSGAGGALAIRMSLAVFLGVLTGSESLVVDAAGHGWEAGCGAAGDVAGAGHENKDWALCCCLCMKISLSH